MRWNAQLVKNYKGKDLNKGSFHNQKKKKKTQGKGLNFSNIHGKTGLVFCHIQEAGGAKPSLTTGSEMGLREGRISAQPCTACLWTEVQSAGRAGGPPLGVLVAYSPDSQVRDLNQTQGKRLGKEKAFRQLAPQGRRVCDTGRGRK